jgi:hypothetical protein
MDSGDSQDHSKRKRSRYTNGSAAPYKGHINGSAT